MDAKDQPISPASHRSPSGRSLWRELADGSAGPGVRVLVSVASAWLLGGLATLVSYFLTLRVLWADTGRGVGWRALRHESFLAGLIVGGIMWVVLLWWIWSRPLRQRGLWFSGAMTVGVWIVTAALCVAADVCLRRDEHYVIFGIISIAIAGTLLLWLQAWRLRHCGRPRIHPDDGLLNVSCPECDYRMVGLTESRCPECGSQYALDELLARQGFEPSDHRQPSAPRTV